MIVFTEKIEEIIVERIRSLLGLEGSGPLNGKELRNLSLQVKELSDYFTKRQEERPDRYMEDKGLLAAYVAYFLPVNLPKIIKPLAELFSHPNLKPGSDGSFTVLDLGCGPGTAIVGLMEFLAASPSFKEKAVFKITAVDSTKEVADEADYFIKKAWEVYSRKLADKNMTSMKLRALNLDMGKINEKAIGGAKYDVIIMSNSIGEMAGNMTKSTSFVEGLSAKFLKDDGSIIIIEPALRDSSRRLLKLRDGLLESGKMNIYSPCLTQEQCIALDNEKDWCHEADEWEAPGIVQELDRLTGFEKSRLNYSYLILRKDGLSLSDVLAEEKGERFRVVSDLLVMKGDKRLYLCGERGRIQVGRLDRERSDSNETFDKLKRGDVVFVEGLKEKGSLFRIGEESSVKLFHVNAR